MLGHPSDVNYFVSTISHIQYKNENWNIEMPQCTVKKVNIFHWKTKKIS